MGTKSQSEPGQTLGQFTRAHAPPNEISSARSRLYSLGQRNLAMASLVGTFNTLTTLVPSMTAEERLSLFLHSLPPHIRPMVEDGTNSSGGCATLSVAGGSVAA